MNSQNGEESNNQISLNSNKNSKGKKVYDEPPNLAPQIEFYNPFDTLGHQQSEIIAHDFPRVKMKKMTNGQGPLCQLNN